MRWIAFGAEAEGVIAIGQVATGVIAIGQIATGVIAIGQVARGFVAIGQGAVGLFAVGMGSVGVVWSIGMVGVGGRGAGLILPLVPSLGPTLKKPDLRSSRTVLASTGGGWIAARVDPGDRPTLQDGGALDIRFDAPLRPAIEAMTGPTHVWARLARRDERMVCEELVAVPVPRWTSTRWWVIWALQLSALGIVSMIFWFVAGIPVVSALFDPGGILVGR